jgi:hypothetical protein
MTIQTGSRSRRDCGVLARRYWRHPLLYYGLRARRSWPHGVPADPAGAFRGTVGAPAPGLDDVCAAGKIRMRAGRGRFHIQPVKPSWFWGRTYASALTLRNLATPVAPSSSQLSRRQPTGSSFRKTLVIGRNPISAPFRSF